MTILQAMLWMEIQTLITTMGLVLTLDRINLLGGQWIYKLQYLSQKLLSQTEEIVITVVRK